MTYKRADTTALCRFCCEGLGAVQHGIFEDLHAEQGSSLSHRTYQTLINYTKKDCSNVASLSCLAGLACSQTCGDDRVVVLLAVWATMIVVLSTHLGTLRVINVRCYSKS